MVSVWKNHDSFRLLLPQREGILTLSEIEKTGPKEETAVWRHLHNNTLWSNLILERGLTIGRGRSAGGCNVCPKGWFSQLQQRERPPERLLGKVFPSFQGSHCLSAVGSATDSRKATESQPLSISQFPLQYTRGRRKQKGRNAWQY